MMQFKLKISFIFLSIYFFKISDTMTASKKVKVPFHPNLIIYPPVMQMSDILMTITIKMNPTRMISIMNKKAMMTNIMMNMVIMIQPMIIQNMMINTIISMKIMITSDRAKLMSAMKVLARIEANKI